MIDTAWSGLSPTVGEALFDANGEPSQLMGTVQKQLEQLEHEIQRTRLVCSKLQELDLLRDMRFEAQIPGGQSFTVDGFFTVDEARALVAAIRIAQPRLDSVLAPQAERAQGMRQAVGARFQVAVAERSIAEQHRGVVRPLAGRALEVDAEVHRKLRSGGRSFEREHQSRKRRGLLGSTDRRV